MRFHCIIIHTMINTFPRRRCLLLGDDQSDSDSLGVSDLLGVFVETSEVVFKESS